MEDRHGQVGHPQRKLRRGINAVPLRYNAAWTLCCVGIDILYHPVYYLCYNATSTIVASCVERMFPRWTPMTCQRGQYHGTTNLFYSFSSCTYRLYLLYLRYGRKRGFACVRVL